MSLASATAAPARPAPDGGSQGTDRQARWLKAREKAEQVRPAIEGSRPVWVVQGSSGAHRVEAHGLSYRCDCDAGKHGQPCYCQAAVAILPEEIAFRLAARRCPGYLKEHAPVRLPDGATEIRYWCAACDLCGDAPEEATDEPDTHSVRADLLPAAPPAWVAEQRAGLADQVAYVRRAYGGARPTSEDAAPAPARRPYDAMEERVNRDYADACVAASKRQQQALRNSDTPFVDEMRRLSAERHAAALAAPVGTFTELCGEVPHAALFS